MATSLEWTTTDFRPPRKRWENDIISGQTVCIRINIPRDVTNGGGGNCPPPTHTHEKTGRKAKMGSEKMGGRKGKGGRGTEKRKKEKRKERKGKEKRERKKKRLKMKGEKGRSV